MVNYSTIYFFIFLYDISIIIPALMALKGAEERAKYWCLFGSVEQIGNYY
jgi:hypothetical protein